MGLEASDQELITLRVSKQVEGALRESRSSLVDDIVARLTADERLTLFEGRLRTKVEGEVEASLKKRYTAIAIVVAALVGGGSAGVTQAILGSLNKEAKAVLDQTIASIDAYKDF